MKINTIDLFVGCGGLSEGFEQSQKYKMLGAVEWELAPVKTLRNHLKNKWKMSDSDKRVLQFDIQRTDELFKGWNDEKFGISSGLGSLIGSESLDVIIGGPPCQAYSIVGRARDPKGMADDPRNHLYLHYVKFLKKYKPKMFVFENVPGILSAKNGEFLEKIKEAIDEAGYIVEHKTLTSKDFGVLQNRRRVILIGWKKNKKLKYPVFDKFPIQGEIMKDLFYDLPKLEPGEEKAPATYTKSINEYLKLSKIRNGIDFTTQHVARNNNERDLEIYRTAIDLWVNKGRRLNYADLPSELKTHKNETAFLNRFQVVDPKGVCHTVVAHISADGHYYIYPDLKQVRSISVREAARIQSFPDDFFFEGGRTAAFKQIGNAVPPLMAEGIANKIKEMICL